MSQTIVAGDWGLAQRAHLQAAAALIYASFPEFYGIFGSTPDEISPTIADLLAEPTSEIGISRLLFVDGQFAGISTHLPSRETGRRRLIALRHLLATPGCPPDAQTRAAAFSRGVEPVPAEGLLWTRLTISPNHRGRGLARLMGTALIEEARSEGHPVLYSHVHRDNVASIRMHDSLGFHRLSDRDYTHVAFIHLLR